jgi:hypothetical protein
MSKFSLRRRKNTNQISAAVKKGQLHVYYKYYQSYFIQCIIEASIGCLDKQNLDMQNLDMHN